MIPAKPVRLSIEVVVVHPGMVTEAGRLIGMEPDYDRVLADLRAARLAAVREGRRQLDLDIGWAARLVQLHRDDPLTWLLVDRAQYGDSN